MDRMIYTALSGAKQILDQQAAVSNNLANASTPAFRAQINLYRAVPVSGAGDADPRLHARAPRRAPT